LGRNYFLYIAIAITTAITVGSLISTKNVGQVPVHVSDKVIHFGAYFLLALSWFLTFRNKYKLFINYLIIALAVFVYGIIIEVCQMVLTTYREADVYDMLANLGGVLAALLFFTLVNKKKMS